VIAIAGAAEHADPSQRTGLIIFGLLVSVPFIVFGSQIILKLLDRFPIIVLLGAALLGWIAGGLIVGDVWVKPLLPDHMAVHYTGSVIGAAVVIIVAKVLERRRARAASA
jgi:predicted tellurium resistance membrane protein TerC